MIALHLKPAESNRILARLPATERRAVGNASEEVDLVAGEVLCNVGDRIQHVYFPCAGVLLLSTQTIDSPAIGVGFLRSDGMFGLGVATGLSTSDVSAASQGRGQGHLVRVKAFLTLLKGCPSLRSALFASSAAVSAQRSRNVACVAFHSSSQRVARWMMDLSEGGKGAGFVATQGEMAIALGLQRAAVNQVSGELQRAGAIRYSRGAVTILDRPRLGAMACRCSMSAGSVPQAA